MKKVIYLLFLISLFCQIAANEVTRLDFARRLTKDKLYTEALNELNNILLESKNKTVLSESQYLIAEIYDAQNQPEKSENIYIQLLTEDAQSSPYIREKSLEKLATLYKSQAKWSKAKEYYKKLLTLYANTDSAKQNIINYLETYYQQKEFNDIISNGRELLNLFPKDPVQAEIMLIMAQAYYEMQIVSEAETLINQIKSQYPDSQARNKSLELQIVIIKRNKGTESAVDEIKKHLKTPLNRNIEENLNRLLMDYLIELDQNDIAAKTARLLIDKFNLSPELDYYYYQWIRLNAILKNPSPVLKEKEKYSGIFYKSIYKFNAYLYIAQNFLQADEPWTASGLVESFEPEVKDPALKFEYIRLKSNIYEKQENYTAVLNTLSHLIHYYGFLGHNAELFYQTASVYEKHFNDPSQAVLYYSQALSLTHNPLLKFKTLNQIAICYEKLKDNKNALDFYKRINLNAVSESEKNQIIQKINQLQLFYVKDSDLLLKEILLQFISSDQDKAVKAAILFGWGLKDFEQASELLKSVKAPQAENERLKMLCMLAYKYMLEKNQQQYQQAISEINQIKTKINPNSNAVKSADIMIAWLENKGQLNNSVILTLEDYFLTPQPQDNYSFDNWFRYWLADYYLSQKLYDRFIAISQEIKKDSFVNENDFIRIQLNLAEAYYQKKDYTRSFQHYQQADSWLNLSNPLYYYHFTMAQYYTGNKESALSTLKHIILNIDTIPEINEARYLIVDHAIEKKFYQDGIDVITNIAPNKRSDKDYIYLSNLYNLSNLPEKEKEALMYIQKKDIKMLRRLAVLHEYTRDLILAQYTWDELSKKETDPYLKAYALFSLANIAYDSKEFNQAINYYQQALSFTGKKTEIESIPFSIPQMVKRYIICYYKINNRPKAEGLEKEYLSVLNQEPEAKIELKLNQAIYYVKMDPKKAEKSLNDIIKDQFTPQYVLDEAYLWRGILYLQLKKNTDAENDFLLIANAENVDIRNQAHLKLGTYYFTNENFEQASQYYYSVMINDTTGVYALDAASNYAMLAKITKEWEKAVQTYQMIINRWGDKQISSETQFNIAFCYYQAKLYDKSILIFEKYFNTFLTDDLKAEALYWIAENYYAKEEYELAVNAFLKVPYSYPNVIKWAAVAELRAGESYLKNKQVDRAISTFKKVISLYGKNSEAGIEAVKNLDLLGVK